MNHGLSSLLCGLGRKHDTASRLIYLENDVSLGVDNARILAWRADDEDHVRPCLPNLVNSSCRTRDRLAPDDRLHIRVRSHGHSVGDHGLCLCGKVIRVGGSDDHIAVLLLHLPCLSDLLIALGSRTGDDTDLKVCRRSFSLCRSLCLLVPCRRSGLCRRCGSCSVRRRGSICRGVPAAACQGERHSRCQCQAK